MNARTKARDLSQRTAAFARRLPRPGRRAALVTAFVRRLPRPGQAAFIVARFAVSVAVVGFAVWQIWPVVPSVWLALTSIVGMAIVVAVLFVGVFGLFTSSSKLHTKLGTDGDGKTTDKHHIEIAKRDSKTGQLIADIELGLFGWLSRHSVAIVRTVGPHFLRLLGAAVGLWALWIGLGRLGIAAGLDANARPANLLMGRAHDLVQMCLHPALRRSNAPASESEFGPYRKEIEAAIVESVTNDGRPELAKRWKFHSWTETSTDHVYEYRATESGGKDFMTLKAIWVSMAPMMGYHTQIDDGVTCSAATKSGAHYIVKIPHEKDTFPGLPETDLTTFINDHRDEVIGHPRKFCFGLDERSNPVWAEFSDATAHFLVAGATGGGKSSSGMISPVTQLLSSNSPKQMRLWILDGTRGQAIAVFEGDPHLERSAQAGDGEAVLSIIRDYGKKMNDFYKTLHGRDWTPASGPWHLLVIEEWATLNDMLDSKQRDELFHLLNPIASTGRAAGFHILLVTQKGDRKSLDTRLTTNFNGRVCGYFRRKSDYAIVLDDYNVVIPNIKGRLALAVEGETTIFQGLFADDLAVKKILADSWPEESGGGPAPHKPDFTSRGPEPTPSKPDFKSRPTTRPEPQRWNSSDDERQAPGPTRPAPQPVRPAADPDTITQRLVREMSIYTAAQIIFEYTARTRKFPSINRDILRGMVTALGFTPPRNEKLTAAVSDLKNAGVILVKGRERNFVDKDWPAILALLDSYEDGKDDEDEDEDA